MPSEASASKMTSISPVACRRQTEPIDDHYTGDEGKVGS
jgi:hypothetical protein